MINKAYIAIFFRLSKNKYSIMHYTHSIAFGFLLTETGIQDIADKDFATDI